MERGDTGIMDPALIKARELLECVTPLRLDCGRQCGAACCQPDEDGKGGMLLFPGEEELYSSLPEGFDIEQTDEGLLLTCEGFCERNERPLSCRLFPLFVFPEGETGYTLELDPRGHIVCPLCEYGIRAFSPEFVNAVKQAAEVLMGSEKQRAFLRNTAQRIRDMQKWREE